VRLKRRPGHEAKKLEKIMPVFSASWRRPKNEIKNLSIIS
jgi:hypothetical protein